MGRSQPIPSPHPSLARLPRSDAPTLKAETTAPPLPADPPSPVVALTPQTEAPVIAPGPQKKTKKRTAQTAAKTARTGAAQTIPTQQPTPADKAPSIRHLKQQAAHAGIKNYGRMTQDERLKALAQKDP